MNSNPISGKNLLAQSALMQSVQSKKKEVSKFELTETQYNFELPESKKVFIEELDIKINILKPKVDYDEFSTEVFKKASFW